VKESEEMRVLSGVVYLMMKCCQLITQQICGCCRRLATLSMLYRRF